MTISPSLAITSTESQNTESQSKEQSWVERGKNVLMHTYATNPIVLTKGSGSYVQDVDGKTYLDFAAGIAVNSLGHCNPLYVEALTEQLHKLSHCSNLYYNTQAIKLAEKLVQDSAFDRAFFCNSGAEAIEAAIKLSRKYAKAKKGEACTKILSMSNSFHGRTYGALSATGQTKYQAGYEPMVPAFETVIFNNIDSVLEKNLDQVAAIIIEPVQGEGGVHIVDKGFLSQVKDLCTAHDIVLIFDEIQCGVGRTGKFFACENFAIAPDIVALAKGLGAGFPIGAILANEKVASAFNPGDHGSTFGGNALAATAALASVGVIKEEIFLQSVLAKSQLLQSALTGLKSQNDAVSDLRGIGLMLGLEFKTLVKPIVAKCAEYGLLLVSAGDNVIRFLPPLTVSAGEIEEAVAILQDVLTALKQQDC